MAAQGMMLCTVGLGDAADFNSGLLVSLSDRGQGTFIYASQPILLTLVNDPMQTGELLSQIQAAALKYGQINIAAYL
jgi:Ca-activated chloride channel family protein